MLDQAFRPTQLKKLPLRNRFIKTATNEGMYTNGIPNQKLTDLHVSMAKGELGLTTVSYASVSRDGRTFKTQMYVHEESLNALEQLTKAVHSAGGKVSIQLTHCGYFTKNKEVKRPLAPSRIFNEYGCLSGILFSKAMTRSDMDRLRDDFVRSAHQLKAIGFDALELHMGHGYLLSQFLSPKTNRRTDEYGGSIENRARFPMEIFTAIQAAVGPDFPVLVKLNLDDGFPGGFSLDDCKYVAKALEAVGCAAIVLSGGFTSKTPFYLLRGKIPLKGMIENGTSLAEKMTMRLFGPWIIKPYTFKPNFFLEQAKIIRASVQLPLAYLGGVNSKKDIEALVEEGFDFITIGRPLIHDPNFLIKIREGEIERSGCNRCNECIVEMDRGGIRCVLPDAPANV